MRVIAGTARRIELKTPKGPGPRPTTDRIKETLYNILAPYLADCFFLDLFAGSGGIGIEALSRGASEAVFVDQDPEAAACIRENLQKTHLEDRGRVMESSALTALRRLEGNGRVFDIIFMDPPYGMGLEREVLEYLQHSAMVDDQTWIIAEAAAEEDFSYLEKLGFMIDRVKRYGTNQHLFIGRVRKEGAEA